MKAHYASAIVAFGLLIPGVRVQQFGHVFRAILPSWQLKFLLQPYMVCGWAVSLQARASSDQRWPRAAQESGDKGGPQGSGEKLFL